MSFAIPSKVWDVVREAARLNGRKPGDWALDALGNAARQPVVAQWDALMATCNGVNAGEVVLLLELARCLADLEEARRQVTAGGAFVLSKSGDLVENPWSAREQKLRAQAIQLRKSLPCLGAEVVTREFAEKAAAKERAQAEAEAKAKAEAAAKKAAAAEKRRQQKEARAARRREEEAT